MLQQAIEAEVNEHIKTHSVQINGRGRRMVTCNGHLPERDIQTGMGPISVWQPRIRDNREDQHFHSGILLRHARRVPSVEIVIPTKGPKDFHPQLLTISQCKIDEPIDFEQVLRV